MANNFTKLQIPANGKWPVAEVLVELCCLWTEPGLRDKASLYLKISSCWLHVHIYCMGIRGTSIISDLTISKKANKHNFSSLTVCCPADHVCFTVDIANAGRKCSAIALQLLSILCPCQAVDRITPTCHEGIKMLGLRLKKKKTHTHTIGQRGYINVASRLCRSS